MYYEGDWVNDKWSGQGYLLSSGPAEFTGAFFDNNLHGYGQLKFEDGEIVEGTW